MQAIIIDDEPLACSLLGKMLELFCPEVILVDSINDPLKGIEILKSTPPDLVFLDISMPVKTGFDVLLELGEVNFDVVFTTAYHEYAIRAFDFNAIGYLLKPINDEKLIKAVERSKNNQFSKLKPAVLEFLRQMNPQKAPSKIPFPTSEGLELIAPDSIVYCAADGNYTKIFLKNQKELLISKAIGVVEKMVERAGFFRVHHSYLVNISHIEKYIKADGGSLQLLEGNFLVPVSRNKRELLLEQLKP